MPAPLQTPKPAPQSLPWSYPGFWQHNSYTLAGAVVWLATIGFEYYYRAYFMVTPHNVRFTLLLPLLGGFILMRVHPVFEMPGYKCKLGYLLRAATILAMASIVLVLVSVIYREVQELLTAWHKRGY